jgi:hypothetical protein
MSTRPDQTKPGAYAVIRGARLLGALLLCNAGCRGPDERAAVRLPPPYAAPVPTVAAIEAGDFHTRIAFLASDSLRGRATPSPGLELAAQYIAGEFSRLGLEPGGDAGGFLQWYDLQTDDGERRAPNAVGILRGSDPALRDTYVVFSAHMDHVGVGPPDARGDSIYNGADDDASGTSAVLELAEAFAARPERPARSIVFLTVSGEEVGLFGSDAFLRAGPIPARRIVADINIDMIGRNAPDTLVAIGLAYSSLGATASQVARQHPDLGLTVVDDPWPNEQFFFRSDHFNFARAGVPALFLFSGVHPDYHRPSDEVERIDTDKASRIARLAYQLGLAVASATEAPAWTAAGTAAMRR